ncbi:hypothetical protein ABTZ46_10015 [Nocardioides sp. NPDC126508]
MVLSEFVGAIRRRWYLAVIGILLTGVLGWSASAFVAPSYTARGLVLMLPSKNAVGPGGNPFLGLGGLDLPARVVVAYYTSAPAQEAIAEVTPGASVTVSMEESTRGPVIAIDVSADSEANAIEALNFVADSIPETLGRLQDEVKAKGNARLRSQPLALDETAAVDGSGQLRARIMAVVLGLALTAVLVYAIDGIMLRRRLAREESARAGEIVPDEADEADELDDHVVQRLHG